jgi:hypothetical protein
MAGTKGCRAATSAGATYPREVLVFAGDQCIIANEPKMASEESQAAFTIMNQIAIC